MSAALDKMRVLLASFPGTIEAGNTAVLNLLLTEMVAWMERAEIEVDQYNAQVEIDNAEVDVYNKRVPIKRRKN